MNSLQALIRYRFSRTLPPHLLNPSRAPTGTPALHTSPRPNFLKIFFTHFYALLRIWLRAHCCVLPPPQPVIKLTAWVLLREASPASKSVSKSFVFRFLADAAQVTAHEGNRRNLNGRLRPPLIQVGSQGELILSVKECLMARYSSESNIFKPMTHEYKR